MPTTPATTAQATAMATLAGTTPARMKDLICVSPLALSAARVARCGRSRSRALANPTSNGIYQLIGYEQVVEAAEIGFGAAGKPTRS